MSTDVARREFFRLTAAGGAALGLGALQGTVGAQPAGVVRRRPIEGTVTEPARELPVSGTVDVLVVGGGIAGVAAAAAAARNGASACLIEKENSLGGLATLGNVVVYLPLCDGKGNQVIFGMGEELLKLSVRDGFNPIPACWGPDGNPEERVKNRYRVKFNPASYLLALEEWVLETGVKLMYDTRLCAVLREGDLVRAAIVENKSGRSAIRCRTIIDASGDADVCAVAGEPTESVRTNVQAGWFYTWDHKQLRLVVNSDEFDRDPRVPPDDGRGYAGDDAEDVTDQIIETRRAIRRRMQALQEKSADTPIFPAIVPTIPCFRMTRRLQGKVVLQESDDRRWFDDAVGMTGDWRKAGPVYYLPLASLAGVANDNLMATGRCMSADGPAWDVTRVIPTCAVTGEAAGTACAMAARDHEGRLSRVPIAALQERLRSRGMLIDRRFAG